MGLQSAMEALPEALLSEQRASFMEDLSEQHLWAYLLQPFCPMWNFFAIAGAMEPWQHFFFVKEIQKGSVSPTRPSATPTSCTWIDHAYVAAPCTLFSGARVGWAHFIAERDLSSQDRARAKENTIYPPKLFLFRKKERESEIECVCVCVRASMTGESSRACFSWLHFIAERNLPSQSSTELERKS